MPIVRLFEKVDHIITSLQYIFITRLLIIIIKLKVSTFPIVVILFHGCVPEELYHHILSVVSYISWESWAFASIIAMQSMMCASNWVQYGLSVPDSKIHGANMGPIWGRQDPGGPHVGPMNFAIRGGICLFDITLSHYHHYADLCQLHSVECVFKIKLILSIIFNMIYGAVCFFVYLFLL